MTTKVVDVANDIFTWLGSPSDISIAFISSWIRGNLGAINNLLLTSFDINDTTFEFTPDISHEVASIIHKSFEIYYYNKVINANLGASAFTAVLEVTSDGATVRRQNANNVAITYVQLRKDAVNELITLINGYKLKTNSPLDVVGEDAIAPGETITTDYIRGAQRA